MINALVFLKKVWSNRRVLSLIFIESRDFYGKVQIAFKDGKIDGMEAKALLGEFLDIFEPLQEVK